jgi:hypothetical protein
MKEQFCCGIIVMALVRIFTVEILTAQQSDAVGVADSVSLGAIVSARIVDDRKAPITIR